VLLCCAGGVHADEAKKPAPKEKKKAEPKKPDPDPDYKPDRIDGKF